MKQKKYLIIPANTDLNRGDQALIWETIRVAKEAGYEGRFSMLKGEESIEQSEIEGIEGLTPILAHPSRAFKNKENNSYNLKLKLKWGSVALFDFIVSMLYLNKFSRGILKKIISKDKRKTLEAFQECECLFVKGGGFLHTYGSVESTYIMYFFLFHIILAQKLKKKVYIMPNSFGPFKGFLVKPMLRRTLFNCELVCSRENISTKAIQEGIGLDVDTYADLGFFLEKEENDKNLEYINFIKAKKEQGMKCVAITVRPYRFPKSENPVQKYNTYIDTFKKFTVWLNEKGYHPIFVEHTLSICTNENDGTSILEITKDLDKKNYTIITNEEFNCRDLKGIYSICDYVIGTRFHSVIFSLAEGVPSIGVTYGGNKGDGIMQDIGLSDCAIPIEEINFDKVTEVFCYMVDNEKEIKDKISRYMEKAHVLRKEMINRLK